MLLAKVLWNHRRLCEAFHQTDSVDDKYVIGANRSRFANPRNANCNYFERADH